MSWRRPTLPQRSTIGAGGLNFRVRNLPASGQVGTGEKRILGASQEVVDKAKPSTVGFDLSYNLNSSCKEDPPITKNNLFLGCFFV